MKLIPKPDEIAREAIIVIAGAVLAALIVDNLPGLKAWLRKQWADGATPPATSAVPVTGGVTGQAAR